MFYAFFDLRITFNCGCNKQIQKVEEFFAHFKLYHSSTAFTCSIDNCNETRNNLEDFKRHTYRTHHIKDWSASQLSLKIGQNSFFRNFLEHHTAQFCLASIDSPPFLEPQDNSMSQISNLHPTTNNENDCSPLFIL